MPRSASRRSGSARRAVRKGKDFERLVARKLRAAGFAVERSQQSRGALSSDLAIKELPHYWMECGHSNNINKIKKLGQAERDARKLGIGRETVCVAVTRKTGVKTIEATLRVSDLIPLIISEPPSFVMVGIDTKYRCIPITIDLDSLIVLMKDKVARNDHRQG